MATLTVLCRNCKALTDAYIGRRHDEPTNEPCCTDCKSGEVIPWKIDHGCPVCGAEVERGRSPEMFWD